ncbi:MAG: sarcosine oxidase subunit delta [Arenicellales bacterium WSBS_2016_MAG_OTU3]
MLLIKCPWCGERDQSEFSCGGEAHIARPLEPDQLSDEEWGDYLFMRKNPKGIQLEQWVHAAGCRKWFNVARDTVTYKIKHVYHIGEPEPDVSAFGLQAEDGRA